MKSKNIFIPCSSLILTDNLPAGEGLIAFNLIKYLSRLNYNIFAAAPKINITKNLEDVQLFEIGNYTFFPAPDEFNYLLRWFLYSLKIKKFFKTLKIAHTPDIIYYMLPFNLNQSYSPILNQPLVVGPIFYPWIQLDENEYSDIEIKQKKEFVLFRKLKTFIKLQLKKYNKKKYIETLDNAKKIIVTLDCVKKFIDPKYHNKIIKIPIGTDTSHFKPFKILPENDTVLFLAYLVKRKGLEYLLKAIELVKKQIPGIKLLIAGDGPDKQYFLNMIEDLNLKDNVELYGHIPHNQTVNLFQKAQIYVLPSLGEPFGMSLVEAMSCGLPIISTNCGGVPEVVGENNQKFLVEPRNHIQLAEKISELLLDYDLCTKVGNNNRDFVVRNYDWRIIAGKYNNLFLNL
jgi:glycosyltransferase involved in cell wall biosynthesis